KTYRNNFFGFRISDFFRPSDFGLRILVTCDLRLSGPRPLTPAFRLLVASMVRLKDIAERAGVSVMTVSKALRDEPDVSANTKARIKVLAQQLGYVPDSSAQGLRTRTTKLFGLVIPSLANPIFSRLVLAIQERVYEMGYDLLLAYTLYIPEREEI